MKRIIPCVLISVMMILSFHSLAHAQPGILCGTVTGHGGARLVDAVVRIGDASFFRSAYPADSTFSIPDLPPGEYTLSVSARGFVAEEYDIRITAGHRALIGLMLTPVYRPTLSTSERSPDKQTPAAIPVRRNRSKLVPGTPIQRSVRASIRSAMALNSGVTTAGVDGITIRCCCFGRPRLIPAYEAIEPVPSIDTVAAGELPRGPEAGDILGDPMAPPDTISTEPSGSPEPYRRRAALPLLR